jgi:aromatic-L-amino-acid decarboxylase
LNIVYFRYRCDDADSPNAKIVADLHEVGIAAPPTTMIGGRLAIRVAIFNHRTQMRDIDTMLRSAAKFGMIAYGKASHAA